MPVATAQPPGPGTISFTGPQVVEGLAKKHNFSKTQLFFDFPAFSKSEFKSHVFSFYHP